MRLNKCLTIILTDIFLISLCTAQTFYPSDTVTQTYFKSISWAHSVMKCHVHAHIPHRCRTHSHRINDFRRWSHHQSASSVKNQTFYSKLFRTTNIHTNRYRMKLNRIIQMDFFFGRTNFLRQTIRYTTKQWTIFSAKVINERGKNWEMFS